MATPGSTALNPDKPAPRRRPRLRQQLVLQFASLVVLFAAAGTVFGENKLALAAECYTLTYNFVPAEAGASTASLPTPDCDGAYTSGITVETDIIPAPGWRLAAFSPGASSIALNKFEATVTADTTINLFMAKVIEGGVPTPTQTVAVAQWHFFVIDVPPGAPNLKVEMTGTGDADLYTRHSVIPLDGPPGPTTNDCRPYITGTSETCEHPAAASGEWYIGVNGFVLTSDFSLTVTICWPFSLTTVPADRPVNRTVASNCDGGYQHGTELSREAVSTSAFPHTGWRGNGQPISGNPLDLTINGPATVVADFSTALDPGDSLTGESIPIAITRSFHIDLPPGVATLQVSVTGVSGDATFRVEHADNLGVDLCSGNVEPPGTANCFVGDPAPSRTWLRVTGTNDAVVTLAASTIRCVQVFAVASPQEGGSVTIQPEFPCAGGYPAGTPVTMTANPEPGYAFAFWSPGGNTVSPLQFDLGPNNTLYTAVFALGLEDGVASPQLDPSDARVFYIDVPENTALLSATASGADYSILATSDWTYEDGCNASSPASCAVLQPAAGRWWITYQNLSDSPQSITIDLTMCHLLIVNIINPEGGVVTADPPSDPACSEGFYTEGTHVTLHATANENYAFAPGLENGIVQDAVISMTGPRDERAIFGARLASGIARQFTGLAEAEPRFAYIDVLPGTGSIEPVVSASFHGFDARFYPPAQGVGCYFNELSTPSSCAENFPAPGRWWLRADPYIDNPPPFTDALSFKVTLSDESICWSLSAAAIPVSATAQPIQVFPAPNCAGGKYLHRTPVALFPGPAVPGYARLHLSVNDPTFYYPQSPITFNIAADAVVEFHYAQRIFEGATTFFSFGSPEFNAFFVDLPAGVTSVTFTAAPMTGVPLMIYSTANQQCGGFTVENPATCTITDPIPARWLFEFAGTQAALTITIETTPSLGPTVDRVTPPNLFINGTEPVELTVDGYDFTAGDVVWLNGTSLATQFISENQLTATVPVEMLGSTLESYGLWVVPASNDTLISNTVTVELARRSTDTNCDGAVTALDALDFMHYLAGYPGNDPCNGDANLDGTHNVADAVRIMAEVAGLVGSLPAGPPVPNFRSTPPFESDSSARTAMLAALPSTRPRIAYSALVE